MTVTIEKIINLEAFSQATTLVAGHAGINNVVTYITASETPDFYEWVSGGEFVLTTLYAFKDHKDLQILNYTELAKRGVSGIGVKVGRFVEAVPQEMIDIANKYDVPLFAVRKNTKFREIIQTITAELNNYQTNILLELDSHYKELTKVALMSGDFAEYIQGFGRRKGGGGVYCFRADLTLLGSYEKYVRGRAQNEREKLKKYLGRHGEVLNPVDCGNFYIFPCVSHKQVLGYLIITDVDQLSEKDKLMASQLTTFLTLKLIDQMETEQKMLAALLDELLYKRNLVEQELKDRLALYGLKHQQRYRIIIVQERDEKYLSLPTSSSVTCCNIIKELLGNAIVINKTNEMVIIGSNEKFNDADAHLFLKTLSDKVSDNVSHIAIGIGSSVVNARDIHTSYKIAKSTLKASSVFGRGGIFYYRHYLVRNLLLRTIGTPEQEYLLANVIHPLLEQDKRYNTQILSTIEATMFSNELEQAAEALFVHTNTVRYRLNKIKSLTGYDFFSAQGRYVITTAYIVYCYSQ